MNSYVLSPWKFAFGEGLRTIKIYYESPDKRLYFVQACLQRNIDIWLAKLYEYVGRQPGIRIQLVIVGVRST